MISACLASESFLFFLVLCDFPRLMLVSALLPAFCFLAQSYNRCPRYYAHKAKLQTTRMRLKFSTPDDSNIIHCDSLSSLLI